ncbi:Uma2 family endonuclease [Romeria aff. gracilis LEGE 07310]|uniref:Uma2 family endonuclease n=1 Tax=Vasconcelosia minhoensis LEGE 07310 TaxID=915328 RepID=A0A8J7DK33_9CYAN|nr:Uma2 family endonuclease [Romeria gracilis]MBE9075891.1 Uma2 family endonuclease [Romeria aff. gracilis LEGE 07310]
MTSIVLNLEPITRFTREQFYTLCQANPDLQMERTAQGDLVIMSPVGGESGRQEAGLITDLSIWNRLTGLGQVFSSSTIFSLPNGADRSPDAAWVSQARWDDLTPEQQKGFLPLCPDFVIELRSPSDRIRPLQVKMQEYLENGLRLGWLIDPQNRQVEVYRPNQPVEVIPFPAALSGEAVLPNFRLQIGE